MRNKFRNKHFVVLMGSGVTSIIGLGMTYIVFHNLSMKHAGIWFLLQSFVALCESSRGGLLATATIKFYAGTDEKRAATVLGSVWFLALGFSAIIISLNGLALLYLPYTNSYEVILGIKWIGVNYLSSLATDVVFWRLQADEQYVKMFWFRMINSCSTIGSFIILVLLHQFTLENVIIWNFLTNCSSSLIGLIWYQPGIRHLGKRTKECVSEIFHYGKYTFGTTLLSSLLGNTNIWILNYVLGPASVAIYHVAMRLMAFVDMPLRTFATTGISEMAIANNSKNMEYVGYVFKKYAGMLTIAFIPFAAIGCVLASLLIQILGGHNFDGNSGEISANVYRLALILAISAPLDQFNGMALDITHHTKTNFYKMVITIAIKVVVGLIFTELLKNVYGIVLSNYVSTFAAIIYGHIQLRKYLPHTIPNIINIGYKELILFLKKNIKFSKKADSTL